jgi:hypothetical protein
MRRAELWKNPDHQSCWRLRWPFSCHGEQRGSSNDLFHLTAARLRFGMNLKGHGGAAAGDQRR